MTWRETILSILGICAPPSIHDHRIHDVNNRNQISETVAELGQRRAQRAFKKIIAAQQSDPRDDDLRKVAATMRRALADRDHPMDAVEAMLRGEPKD